jgi:hypothetical protein
MELIQKNRVLVRLIAAGLGVVILSLTLLFTGFNLRHIPGAFHAAADYIRLKSEEDDDSRGFSVSSVNNGELMLYVPQNNAQKYDEPVVTAVSENNSAITAAITTD